MRRTTPQVAARREMVYEWLADQPDREASRTDLDLHFLQGAHPLIRNRQQLSRVLREDPRFSLRHVGDARSAIWRAVEPEPENDLGPSYSECLDAGLADMIGRLRTPATRDTDTPDGMTARCGGCWRYAADIGGIIIGDDTQDLAGQLDLIGWAWTGGRWLCPRCRRAQRCGKPLFSDR